VGPPFFEFEEDNDADEVVGVSTAQPVSRSIRPSNEANPAGKIRIRIILGYLQNRREQTKLFAGKLISQQNFAMKGRSGLDLKPSPERTAGQSFPWTALLTLFPHRPTKQHDCLLVGQ